MTTSRRACSGYPYPGAGVAALASVLRGIARYCSTKTGIRRAVHPAPASAPAK